MKTKLFFLFALLLPMLASAQTESDVQNSGCLYENETQEEEGQSVQSIVLTKEGSTLSVQLLNYESNCGTTDFSVTPYVNSSSGHYWVSINVEPVVPAAMNCICPFNISFTIHDFEPNNFDFYCWWYNKNVELTEGEPFVMAKIDDICYYLFSSTNEAKVIDYNYTGDIEIPETVVYNGTEYRVTAITDNAFVGSNGLTSVHFPNSLQSIGTNAFQNCSNLTSVTIPNSVTTIHNHAFWNCTGLTAVSFESNSSLKTIGMFAFGDCTSLKSITIPNSVTEIGRYAFRNCGKLTSITIPNSVTEIGEAALQGCNGLISIVVEKGNKVYDSREGCNAIIKTSENELLAGCRTTTIPNDVSAIGNYAFFGCTNLRSITLPNSLTTIGNYAFEGCNSLTSISIPNSVTEIGSDAFRGCSGLTSVTIPNSVTSIGAAAFRRCENLTSITIGNKVNYIGHQAFEECHKFMDVYCYAENVPKTENTIFFNSNIENATLHVPAASLGTYQATEPWSNFKEIVALADQMAYHPFLEEGKEWICHTQNPYNGQVYDFRYYLGEEVERYGHVYRELIMENYGNYGRTERCAYLREEGQKVYVDYLGHKVLLYDFGMKVGDRIQGFASHTELGSFNMLEVISEDTIEVGGVKRRRLGLAECSSPDDTPTEAKGYWVEGIGSSLSPVCTAGWSPVTDPIVVTSCRLNGNELISASDFGRLIESPYPLETSLPYRPIFKEGKRWAKRINYHHEERENRQTIIRTWEEDKDLSYVVRGDTVIEDETWKKVYYETEGTTYLVGWGMDKDRNVWFYDTREKKTIHLYDFNLMKYNHVFPDEKGSFLDRVEAVECRGNMLNAYYLSDRLMQPNNWIACVEGVGFRMGLLPYELDYILTQWEGDIYTIITPRYIGCYEGDECIFSLANFNDLSATDGIEPTEMVVEKPRKDGHTYDLQGRRMAEGQPLQRGIYVKDGRKFVVK